MDREKAIRNIFDRGVISEIFPNEKAFIEKLKSKETLHLYIGIDPTASAIHLGHAQNLMLLEDFRQLGVKVTILIGGFTARIGDPTDKDSKRKEITKSEVEKFSSKWNKQFLPFIKLGFINNAKVVNNSDWLDKLSLEKFFSIIKNTTVSNLIERDMFQNRIKEGKAIHLNEFLYPVLQGYDSVHLNVDGEVCGTDQTFNALVGRDMLKQMKRKEKFVISTKLIEDKATGKLMSKSNETGVFIEFNPDSAKNMYGKIMSLPDGMMRSLFLGVTRIPKDEIENILSGHPLKAKKRLAFDIVARVYGSKEGVKSEDSFVTQFQKGEIPNDVMEVKVDGVELIIPFLVKYKLAESNGDARRKIKDGAVKLDNKKIYESEIEIDPSKYQILKVGRKIIKLK